MKKLLISMIIAALISVIIPLLILKVFAPGENADSTAPAPTASAESI